MSQMVCGLEKQRYFFLFIIIGSFLIYFTSYQQELPILPMTHTIPLVSEDTITADVPFQDLLIMFQDELPIIQPFEEYVIRKYKNFPVIRFDFHNTANYQVFLEQYGNKITKIEPNRICDSSLDYITESNISNRISRAMIQDSTGASYLINQLGIRGQRTRIGIVDSGVSNHNTEFNDRIKGREVFVNQANGYSQDITSTIDNQGHGTHIAGLAAGATTGIAPEAEIYSAKVVEIGVAGAGGGILEETTAGFLDAFDYLVNNSVDVINISLGQYHNLPSGLRDEIINYVSIIHNIVFSISIGNSGTSYGDRGTLNNPSTALQCIAVTATDVAETSIANYASRGPKVDYSLKPDITAPGTNLDGPSRTGTGTITKSGTSMAAPIVGGAAALLIDYLKQKNQSYTAATIKAALLAGARSLGEPIWEEGAGFLNVTRSWEILNTTSLINNSPNIGYLHPQKLPFDPYKVLFTGSSIEFNLTAISSLQISSQIDISDSLSDFVSFHKEEYLLNHTCLLPINFTIPITSTPQFVFGNISVGDLLITIEFEIREPVARILFDESLNKIVRHGYSVPYIYEIQGDSSNTVGMYSEFTKFLAYDNDYSVTPHVSGDLTLAKLLNFDVLILANPLSLATDIFMDWLIDPGNDYISLSKVSKDAIFQYVSLGGGVLIFNTIGTYCNITGINELITPFSIQIQAQSESIIRSSHFTNHSLNFTDSIASFPFRGNYLQAFGNETQIIAEYENQPTVVSYEGSTGGRVLVFGTDLIFDNIGISTNFYSGNAESNRVLAFNSVAWLAQGDYIETTTTNIPEFSFLLVLSIVLVALAIIALRKQIF
jgi:hypothetical protein